jgi:hypothetical protein
MQLQALLPDQLIGGNLPMVNTLQLVGLESVFDRYLEFWHSEPAQYDALDIPVNPIALELAWRNCLLWHEEDKARRTDVDDSAIAAVKRAIDKLNQQRNDLIEKLDEAILAEVSRAVPEPTTGVINSETPGSIVDRISIMSLKVYHMDEDSRRVDINAEHRELSLHRLAVLKLQRFDLYTALGELLADYLAGRKRMKLYKQFKMYNDPALNPEMYRTAEKKP